MDPAKLSELESDAKRAAVVMLDVGPRLTPLRVAKVLTLSENRAREALRCLDEQGLAMVMGIQRYSLTELGARRARDWKAGKP